MATVRRVRLPAAAAEPVRLERPAGTRTVRLEVDVRKELPGFDAVIRTAAGKAVWRAQGLAPPETGRPLVLTVPATALGSGRYRLWVEGETLRDSSAAVPLVLEYELRVVRAR